MYENGFFYLFYVIISWDKMFSFWNWFWWFRWKLQNGILQESTKRASDMEEPLSYYDVTEQNFRDENFALKMQRISKEIVQFNEISSLIQFYIQMTQDARTEASSFTWKFISTKLLKKFIPRASIVNFSLFWFTEI